MTDGERAFIASLVSERSARVLTFREGYGPGRFLKLTRNVAVTWPFGKVGQVWVSPDYWPEFTYEERLSTLCHEAWHVDQLIDHGRVGFIWRYFGPPSWRFWARVIAGRRPSVTTHPMEAPAYRIGQWARERITDKAPRPEQRSALRQEA